MSGALGRRPALIQNCNDQYGFQDRELVQVTKGDAAAGIRAVDGLTAVVDDLGDLIEKLDLTNRFFGGTSKGVEAFLLQSEGVVFDLRSIKKMFSTVAKLLGGWIKMFQIHAEAEESMIRDHWSKHERLHQYWEEGDVIQRAIDRANWDHGETVPWTDAEARHHAALVVRLNDVGELSRGLSRELDELAADAKRNAKDFDRQSKKTAAKLKTAIEAGFSSVDKDSWFERSKNTLADNDAALKNVQKWADRLSTAGDVITIAGAAISLVPGGVVIGGPMIGGGKAISTGGTVVSLGVDGVRVATGQQGAGTDLIFNAATTGAGSYVGSITGPGAGAAAGIAIDKTGGALKPDRSGAPAPIKPTKFPPGKVTIPSTGSGSQQTSIHVDQPYPSVVDAMPKPMKITIHPPKPWTPAPGNPYYIKAAYYTKVAQ